MGVPRPGEEIASSTLRNVVFADDEAVEEVAGGVGAVFGEVIAVKNRGGLTGGRALERVVNACVGALPYVCV